MDGETLYKSIRLGESNPEYLDYYIIPESISASYCDLKCYGIKIEKTTLYEGGGKIIETQQINNVFYREKDAVEFVTYAAASKTEPKNLRFVMENYILEGLDRAKQRT